MMLFQRSHCWSYDKKNVKKEEKIPIVALFIENNQQTKKTDYDACINKHVHNNLKPRVSKEKPSHQ